MLGSTPDSPRDPLYRSDLPVSLEKAFLCSWSQGSHAATEMLRGVFRGVGTVPSSDQDIRNALIRIIVGVCPTGNRSRPYDRSQLEVDQKIALRFIEQKGERSDETMAALGYRALSRDAKESTLLHALGVLTALDSQRGIRLAYALTLLKDENDIELGLASLQQNSPGLYFSRAYEIMLEGRVSMKVRDQHRPVINDLLTGSRAEIPKIPEMYGAVLPPGVTSEVAEMSGVSVPTQRFRQQAQTIAAVIRGRDADELEAAISLLSRWDPDLTVVACASHHARAEKFPMERPTAILRERAPIVARALGAA